MKINWKVRFQHRPFIIALFALVMLLVQQVASFFGVDTTLYNDQVTDLFNTVLAILILLGIVSDPTTNGISDSQQALRYDKPKE
ncbi:phage holin [Psychrobacillus lasiicapitis]|uniref:Phage holin n=1 Tax=Psychrobacillus lasiicapitis TaxID=1636719 RepID=A0A544TAC1_9BACI|nr:phage holin [Psychrobacillus lasiicapitis]TQR14410.1 phage holin [Psychrobacillus lasiicapitis]GGA31579.1 holin [Psychrobacillus lasiicapitis]